MSTASTRFKHLGYLDFEAEIDRADGDTFSLRVDSPAGDVKTTMRLPFTAQELEVQLLRIENALLSASRTRRLAPTAQQQAVEAFGGALFDALFPENVRSLYDV